MKKILQTRLHKPGVVNGNCFPAVIACFLDLESAEDVIQIQDKFESEPKGQWIIDLHEWLYANGRWEWGTMKDHVYDDSYYLVVGPTKRSTEVLHVCIYQNGKLWHDPHPDQSGLTEELYFEYLIQD